jgi:hypothetical protein
MTDPTDEEWRRLFSAASAFRALRPWEKMADDEIFGIVDPASGEIGWCAVIGALGESLGLVVNMGDAGLLAYDLLHKGSDAMRVGSALRGFLFMFVDRKELGQRDLVPIRALGLAFRGRQAWPCFRSLRPGYAAWHIDGEEARYFATALEQAAVVCARVGTGLDLRRDPGSLLVRGPAGAGWEERWVPRPLAPPLEPLEPKLDRERVERIALRCRRSDECWECGQFVLPAEAPDGEGRPFFPAAFLIVEASGLVLNAGVDGPPFPLEFVQGEFLGTIEKLGVLPRQVAVAGDRVRRAIAPAAARLGVKLAMPGALPAFDDARASLEQHVG